MKKIIALVLFIGLMHSCATKDDVVYFNGMSSADNSIGLDSYSPTYHIDDELQQKEFSLKIMDKGEQIRVPFNDLLSTLEQQK